MVVSRGNIPGVVPEQGFKIHKIAAKLLTNLGENLKKELWIQCDKKEVNLPNTNWAYKNFHLVLSNHILRPVVKNPVLWIRIRSDPYHFAGSDRQALEAGPVSIYFNQM